MYSPFQENQRSAKQQKITVKIKTPSLLSTNYTKHIDDLDRSMTATDLIVRVWRDRTIDRHQQWGQFQQWKFRRWESAADQSKAFIDVFATTFKSAPNWKQKDKNGENKIKMKTFDRTNFVRMLGEMRSNNDMCARFMHQIFNCCPTNTDKLANQLLWNFKFIHRRDFKIVERRRYCTSWGNRCTFSTVLRYLLKKKEA